MLNEFISNPNQRKLQINKAPANNLSNDNYYAKININALSNAMHKLSPTGLKLWLYFSKNQDKYTFWLSAVDAMKFASFSKTSYHKAFNELVSVGYLQQESNNINSYQFYEELEEEQEIKITINKECFKF